MSTDYPDQSDETTFVGREPELVQKLVSRQASSIPQALAITAGCTSLTYLELEARANRLAQHLRSLGVGPDVVVGLCIERPAPRLNIPRTVRS
jgi:non-ribosomal peptide synthetase component F